MPIFKRELAFQSDRPEPGMGDWWHLVLDTDKPSLYVEHVWRYMSRQLGGEAEAGTQRFGVNDFLTHAQGLPGGQSAQPTLIDALSDMFRGDGLE